jgi:hypothetical protein
LPVSWLISSKNLLISRFSCTNLTLLSMSAASSMAWLKPFSPPGECFQGDKGGGGAVGGGGVRGGFRGEMSGHGDDLWQSVACGDIHSSIAWLKPFSPPVREKESSFCFVGSQHVL